MRVAALAFQLRPTSRVKSKVYPIGANSQELKMLRLIEHNHRMWHGAHTDDAKDKGTAPEPLMLDGEESAVEAARETEEKNAVDIAAQLGIVI